MNMHMRMRRKNVTNDDAGTEQPQQDARYARNSYPFSNHYYTKGQVTKKCQATMAFKS